VRLTVGIGIFQTYVRLSLWLYENSGVLFVRKVAQPDDPTSWFNFQSDLWHWFAACILNDDGNAILFTNK
jgi:hypothetical protein